MNFRKRLVFLGLLLCFCFLLSMMISQSVSKSSVDGRLYWIQYIQSNTVDNRNPEKGSLSNSSSNPVKPILIATQQPIRSTLPVITTDECPNWFKEWYSNRTVPTSELRFYARNNCQKDTTNTCKKGHLLGTGVQVDRSPISLVNLSASYANRSVTKLGGWWSPENCIPRRHVALVITFRNREEHLPILMRHFLPILKRIGDIHFRVFLVEQVDSHTFNKGKLYNIGFVESQKYFPFDCYIFHDVDLLAENDQIPFACEDSPMHLSVAIDRYKYKLSYHSLVGGILMMTRDHYQKLNGYTNSFWYWGCEDDNMYSRIASNRIRLKRPPPSLARFKQFEHVKRPVYEKKLTSHVFMKKSFKHVKTDGLNHLQYKLLSITDEDFFTRIRVDLQKEKDRLFGVFEYFTNTTEY